MKSVRFIQTGTIVSVCIFFVLSIGASAQSTTESLPPMVTSDSTFANRVVESADSSIAPFEFLGRLGTGDYEPFYELTKAGRRHVQYRSLPEAVIRNSPFMPLSQGGFGQFNSVSVLGAASKDLTVSMDGRSVSSPWNSQYNLEHAQADGLERAEVLVGTDAIGQASTLTQQTLNMQSMRFNTATPYTAFWYAQGGGDFIAADVALAQNVSKETNVSLGVRRTGANGRYLNTQFDIWNIRAGVRTAFTSRTQLFTTYQLTSANSGLWGGLRTIVPLETLTERTSPPVFLTLQDQNRRHDLTATLAQQLSQDSTQVLMVSLYGTLDDMLRIRDSTLHVDQSDTVDNLTYHGRHTGALLRYQVHTSLIKFSVGAGADYSTANASPYSSAVSTFQPQAFSQLSLFPTNQTEISAAARLQMWWDRALFGMGVRGSYVAEDARYTIDFSFAQKAPSAAQGIGLLPESHLLAYTTGQFKWSNLLLNTTLFYRNISDVHLTSSNRDSLQLISTTSTVNLGSNSNVGAYVSALWETPFMEIKPSVRLNWQVGNSTGLNAFPRMFGDICLAYVYRVGTSMVKIGMRGVLVSPVAAPQFVPLTWTNTQPVQEQQWASSGLDAFLIAQLGNAAVKLSYENILAQRWYTTSIAPEIIRDFRLSVTWSFFD